MSREPAKTILIATNGKVTEMTYLAQLKQSSKLKNVRIKVEFVNEEPRQLLRKLQSPNGDVSDYDEVWIVVDEDGKDLTSFVKSCEKLSSKKQPWYPVISRPSFEIWIIAHYERIKNYANQHDAQKHLQQHAPKRKAEKALPQDFPYQAVSQAVMQCHLRGQSLAPIYSLPPLPGTAMPHLVQALKLLDVEN